MPRSRWTSWSVRTRSRVSCWSSPDDGSSSKQQPRLGHQRASELHEPGAPEAQRLDRRSPATSVSPSSAERGVRRVQLVRRRSGEVEAVLPEAARAEPRSSRDDEMVTHGHAAEQLDPLERPAEPEARPPVHRVARDVRTVERHAAPVRVQHAEQAVEERRLAGAVRSDEPDGLSGLHVERDVVERADAGEALRDAACARAASWRRALRRPGGLGRSQVDPARPRALGAGIRAVASIDEALDRRRGPGASAPRGSLRGAARRSSAPRPKSTYCHSSEMPSSFSSSGNRARANPATTAPSTVRALIVTTSTSQTSPKNGA